jgi:hypothetical protein
MQFSIPLYDALIGVNITPDKAKAVVEAFEKERSEMTANLASKEDLRGLRDEIRQSLVLLESRMTIKLGAMLFTAVGLAVALFKVL